jgi:hypothetical protein
MSYSVGELKFESILTAAGFEQGRSKIKRCQ